MMPDLPMPVTMTRPRQSSRMRTASSKRSSSRSTSARIAAASVCSTLRASAMSMSGDSAHARAPEAASAVSRAAASIRLSFMMSGSSAVEAQRVGGVAFRLRRIGVDLHEDRVDARGDAGGCERFDVLRQAGRDAVAGARQLQAVRDVEDDGVAQLAQHRQARACRRRDCCSRS